MARREDGPDRMRPVEAVPAPAEDPTWARLEDQIGWYGRRSRQDQRCYKLLKLLELAIAALLPVVAGLGSPVWVTGGLAAAVVLEGTQHLFQFQEHWIGYRATAEALKRERFLYLAQAGPYAGEDRHRQLAERVEGLLSQEHAEWTASSPAADRAAPRVDRAVRPTLTTSLSVSHGESSTCSTSSYRATHSPQARSAPV